MRYHCSVVNANSYYYCSPLSDAGVRWFLWKNDWHSEFLMQRGGLGSISGDEWIFS
jgi:hypothetical protein